MNEKALDDYIVLWYDEENYTFVEMETKYDEVNGTISTETTHFSRYMIVDKTAWFEAWSEELNYTNVQYEKSACYTVLAVDCSGSMSSSDPITIIADTSYPYINIRDCKRHDAVVNYVGAMDSDDKAAIVAFDSSATTLCGMTDSKLELSYAARKFYSSGGTNYNNVLTESIAILDNSEGSTRKKIVLLSDGKASVSDSVLESAKSSNIKIYTVGLGNSSDSVLQNIADETGGEFFKAYTADELVDIYEEIGVAVDIDTTDTDGDGLYDVYETAGMRLQNGKIIYTDPLLKDTDGDGLEDGQEIDPEMKQLYASGMPSDVAEIQPYYFVMYSDPNSEDGDSDGYLDPDEIVGVTKSDGTRYEPSNPLISNVKCVEISNDYLQIDTPDELDSINWEYGGNQSWFYGENDPNKDDLVSFQLRKGGCGVIASCDNILYWQKYMGFNLTSVDTTGNTISYEEYDEFVRQYSKDYLTPIDVQTPLTLIMKHAGYYPYEDFSETGIMLSDLITAGTGTWGCPVKDLNNSLQDYFADNNYTDINVKMHSVLQIGQKETENIIWESIEDNVPVIIRTNYFSNIVCTYEDGAVSGKFSTHYVTITGIKMDNITGEVALTISTWSHRGTIRLNDFFEETSFGSQIVVIEG